MTGRAGAHPPWESLIAVRESLGLNKAALARKAELNLSHLGALESGRVSPRPETIKKLAEALGVSAAAIPPPGNVPWLEKRVTELVEAELHRYGLTTIRHDTGTTPAIRTETDMQRVARSLTNSEFLKKVISIQKSEANNTDIAHVLSVLKDAVEVLKTYPSAFTF